MFRVMGKGFRHALSEAEADAAFPFFIKNAREPEEKEGTSRSRMRCIFLVWRYSFRGTNTWHLGLCADSKLSIVEYQNGYR